MKSGIEHGRRHRVRCLEFFGSSVRGPLHAKNARPCEDAWQGKQLPSAVAIAVSDGMGSKPSAALGAKAACGAALRAARSWSSATAVGTDWICRLLEAQWRFAVAPEDPQNCAATCHLLAAHKDAGLVYIGLGDGLALFQSGDEPVQFLSTRRSSDFVNETLALGVNHRLGDWIQVRLPKPGKPWIAALVTDGVADDLNPQKLDAFMKWLRHDIARKSRVTRSAALRSALRDWPTPDHLDDKTIAVLFSH